MDVLNIILICFVLGFAIAGAVRGFSGEIATLGGALIAAVALWVSAPVIRDLVFFVAPKLPRDATIFYIGLSLIVIAFIVFFLTSRLIKAIGKWVVPQPFDSVLGFLMGGAKAFLLISILSGVVIASRNYVKTVREKVKQSVVANAAADFWADRLKK